MGAADPLHDDHKYYHFCILMIVITHNKLCVAAVAAELLSAPEHCTAINGCIIKKSATQGRLLLRSV